MKIAPSIFNDVLGPVMRGPSSSHSAASLRIGRLARDLMDGELRDVVVDFETLAFVSGGADQLAEWLPQEDSLEDVRVCRGGQTTIIQLKSRVRPTDDFLRELSANPQVTTVRVLKPVLPVLGRKNLTVPFLSCEDMLAYRKRDGGSLQLWEVGNMMPHERRGTGLGGDAKRSPNPPKKGERASLWRAPECEAAKVMECGGK